MTANNGKCGVGIAYKAKIGGIKLLDGTVNDKVEGTALGKSNFNLTYSSFTLSKSMFYIYKSAHMIYKINYYNI